MSEEAGAIHFYAGHGKPYQRQNFELLYFSDLVREVEVARTTHGKFDKS